MRFSKIEFLSVHSYRCTGIWKRDGNKSITVISSTKNCRPVVSDIWFPPRYRRNSEIMDVENYFLTWTFAIQQVWILDEQYGFYDPEYFWSDTHYFLTFNVHWLSIDFHGGLYERHKFKRGWGIKVISRLKTPRSTRMDRSKMKRAVVPSLTEFSQTQPI